MISVDLETYSAIDLKDVGVYVYSEHPSTRVLCAVFNHPAWLDDAQVWVPGMPKPARVIQAINNGSHFSAFNAGFERTMWRNYLVPKYGWPDIPLDRWHCTAAQAATVGLPKKLERCAEFLELTTRKDMEGHALMMKLCKPDKNGIRIVPTPEQLQRLIEYCIGDVAVEMELAATLPDITPDEQLVWLLDQEINDRGLYVNIDFARAAVAFWDEHLERINNEVKLITGGISGTQVGKLAVWINQQGTQCVSLAKEIVQDLLASTGITTQVRRVLKLRLEAGSTAVKKYPKFIECATKDGRVKGLFRYHGARTGRWAGNLLQPQNFPRGILKVHEIPAAQEFVRRKDFRSIQTIWGNVGSVLGSLCRPTITAGPGKKLVVGDFEQVEARGIAWLAEETALLRAFQSGRDVYKMMAAAIFNTLPKYVTEQQRFLGKTTVLGCGYQMGAVKFKRQLKTQFNTVITVELAERCVYGYRNANPNVVKLWGTLEECVTKAIEGNPTTFRGVKFEKAGVWLWITLPSGRRLAYYKPEIAHDGIRILSTNQGGKPMTEQLYGGKIAENVISGICRDMLVFAMQNLEAENYTVAGTVHDEIVSETDRLACYSAEGMKRIITELPAWAPGFPLAAKCWEGDFYRKD